MRAIIFVLIASAIPLSGCGRRSVEWTEDVRLNDGSTVVVAQRRELEKVGEWANPELIERAVRLEIRDSNGSAAAWVADGIVPLLLDRNASTGRYELVGLYVASFPEAAERPSPPTPPYLQYQLERGQWRERPLSTAYLGRKSNLLLAFGDKEKSGVHVDLRRKLEINRSSRLPAKRRYVLKDATLTDGRNRVPDYIPMKRQFGSEPLTYISSDSDAQSCVGRGGTPTRVCERGADVCLRRFGDAEMPCTDGAQCDGGKCLVWPIPPKKVEDGTPYEGRCIADNNPCKCFLEVREGRFHTGPCVD